MTTFSHEDLAAWAERKRVGWHLTNGRADPEKVHLRPRKLPGCAGRRRSPASMRGGRDVTGAATLSNVSYGASVADGGIDLWPTAGFALLDELHAARGPVTLIAAASLGEADGLVDRLQTDLSLGAVRLGRALAGRPQPPSLPHVEAACGDASVITDLDVLFWPDMNLAPLQLLVTRARRRPTIAVWPGHIAGVRATYSARGRPDYHDISLRDAVVLRPRGTRFSDEVPFTIERILR